MKIGYAHVSTRDLQADALKKAGCEKIYREVVSGAKAERPVLDTLVDNLRPGDVLVIWKLDRLGRSLKHLVELVAQLMAKDVGLQSLNDPTAQGPLVFNIFASLAEFERDLIRERTQAGLSTTRARGHWGGLSSRAKAGDPGDHRVSALHAHRRPGTSADPSRLRRQDASRASPYPPGRDPLFSPWATPAGPNPGATRGAPDPRTSAAVNRLAQTASGGSVCK